MTKAERKALLAIIKFLQFQVYRYPDGMFGGQENKDELLKELRQSRTELDELVGNG